MSACQDLQVNVNEVSAGVPDEAISPSSFPRMGIKCAKCQYGGSNVKKKGLVLLPQVLFSPLLSPPVL